MAGMNGDGAHAYRRDAEAVPEPQPTVEVVGAPEPAPVPAPRAARGRVTSMPVVPPGGPPERPGTPAPALGGPEGRISRLRIGWHTLPGSGLRRMRVDPPPDAGLILGQDRRQLPVPLRLFGPEPAPAALVGGVWAAQLLVFRAFSLGARVIVVTTDPRSWSGFGERATGRPDRLVVLTEDSGTVAAGTAQSPVLTVYDLGVTGPVTAPPPASWHTRLTLLRQLDRPGMSTLQEAGLALLHRLGSEEAVLASSALRLNQETARFLPFMADDMLAVIGDGDDRFVTVRPTGVEHQQLGPPRR
ncbi:hypothetical protein [Actinoplanes sp. NBRC 101535]|uniref:hypothetical protein n=1 Tax=Actinoplanes sp. NBRC 101535 TaxID=3032196 RepID=UPI0024A3C02F|nr:hypothetical protein [Actinoplanes sp. NBRC 101535]GLY01736.1 hypothetical protein Acsp01_21150 [Actinoplanes sp. NBRC 101535]